MKQFLLFISLLPLCLFSQTQIGNDIDGEAAGDYSGQSVSLSSDGSIVAIGASSNDGIYKSSSGHVRIFKNINGIWTQIGDDIDGEAAYDSSGISVSLSSNGNIVAIGAPFNDGNGDNAGHVRVYENINDVWTKIGQDIDGEAAGDRFGFTVSLSSDGSIVAIGAPYNNGNGTHSGHLRVYQNNSGVWWTQIGTDIDGEAEDELGTSVSISSDGSIVASGARINSENGTYSGQVRVYKNNSDNWTQIGQNINGEATGDQSGASVSLSSDGNIVAIGAKENSNENGAYAGQVRVYQNIADVWTQIGDDINGEALADRSGITVSLSSDGSTVAIGSIDNDGNGTSSGHCRIYKNNSGVWTQIGTDIDGEVAQDRAGRVGLSSDGNTVAIGARTNSGNGAYSGHVRVYDLSAVLSANSFNIELSRVYPNPATTEIHITLKNNLQLLKVNLYNQLGQLIKQSKSHTINVSDLSKGMYLVEIETNQGKGIKKVLIE